MASFLKAARRSDPTTADEVAVAPPPEQTWAPALIEAAAALYTVTSQMGFEALLWGRPVRVFGLPFYAGWGLTRDALAAPSRRGG